METFAGGKNLYFAARSRWCGPGIMHHDISAGETRVGAHADKKAGSLAGRCLQR
jgi:hypothetical protein